MNKILLFTLSLNFVKIFHLYCTKCKYIKFNIKFTFIKFTFFKVKSLWKIVRIFEIRILSIWDMEKFKLKNYLKNLTSVKSLKTKIYFKI